MNSWIDNKPLAIRKGIGQVLAQDRQIAKVVYSLNIIQETRVFQSRYYRENIEGSLKIDGHITVLDKLVDLAGCGRLTLELEDGKKIGIDSFREDDPLNNRYKIRIDDAFGWR